MKNIICPNVYTQICLFFSNLIKFLDNKFYEYNGKSQKYENKSCNKYNIKIKSHRCMTCFKKTYI